MLHSIALLGLVPVIAGAQGLRDRLQGMREASRQERPVAVPAGRHRDPQHRLRRRSAQRFDLYLPAGAKDAPVVFYVHGGGWANGDRQPGVANKLAHWLPKGYAVASANYRMVPAAMPLEQTRDIARAVARLQRGASEWTLDPRRAC